MYKFISNIDKKTYDEFVENFSMASFMQEYNWGNVKKNWKSIKCGLYKNNKVIGVCLILVKSLPLGINLFYIPRGYLIDFNNFDDLKYMTNGIKKLAKENKAYVVKIDPNFCISDNDLRGSNVEHIYSDNYKIKHNNLLKLGYKFKGIKKEIGKNFQPQFNIFAPICDSNLNILDEKDILKNYKRIKSYFGEYQNKRGISFEITRDLEKLDEFMNLLHQTEKKHSISLRNKEYFINLMNNYKNAYLILGHIDLNKYLNFLKSSQSNQENIDEAKLLIKSKGAQMVISGALIILPSNKTGIRTSEYLYAGNSLNLTKLHTSAALVFEVIKFSQKNNCHYCNLGGVDGHLNDHLTKFKQNFNGRIMEFAGEYDLPVSWIYYPITFFSPLIINIYKKLR